MTPEALAALHARCFTLPRPWSAAEFSALLGGRGVFLLEEAHEFLLGRALAGEAELLTLAVAPEGRRLGLGRRLLAGFEAGAAARGATEAFLEVAADNVPALALYQGAGWAEAGRRRGYYRRADGPAVDAVILRKVLAAGGQVV